MKSGEEQKNHVQIDVAEKGPYLVKNLEKLQNSKGDDFPAKPVVALCRCGKSSNKPFCDGTHAKIGFTGEKLTDGSKDKRDRYVGQNITIHDNRGLCAHAALCSLASVFRSNQEPWIDPDGAHVEEVIGTVRQCPSGALSYSIDGVEYRDQDRDPMIMISKNGPYMVTGGIELKDETFGDGTSKEHYTLCRCGQSKNKPFCDGAHWDGFEDEDN